MRPTTRGFVALAVVAGAVVAAWLSGPRALNALAAPVLVAVLAGAGQVYRAGEPTVERSQPRRGFPGERRTVELTVDGGGVADVEDHFGDGLSGTATAERTLPATVEYEVRYERRGVRELGPTTVRVRDVLGLVETTYTVEERTEVVVYPTVYSVGDPRAVLRTFGLETDDRSEFDRIREYVPGDSLRDVNWKTSAKYDDLLVTEYTDPTEEEAVHVAAASAPDYADEMATAAATVVVAAVRAGLLVELTVPDGSVQRGQGETVRKHALDLLARTGPGNVSEAAWTDADVRITADEDGVRVGVDGREHYLEDMTRGTANPLMAEGSP